MITKRDLIFGCVLLVIFLFLDLSNCFAGVYVLYEKDTGVVADVSPWDDAVVQAGQEKIYLDDDVELVKPASFYDFKNGKVKFNAKRFNDYEIEEAKKNDEIKKLNDEKAKVDAKLKEMAYDALVAEGVIFERLKKENLK